VQYSGNAFASSSSPTPIASRSSFLKPRTRKPRSTWAELVVKRSGDPAKAVRVLWALGALGTVVSRDLYGDFEAEARKRLAARDPDDWPILAAALALGCPIWTEDTDFFGCGVATWTSASIDSFLPIRNPDRKTND